MALHVGGHIEELYGRAAFLLASDHPIVAELEELLPPLGEDVTVDATLAHNLCSLIGTMLSALATKEDEVKE